MSPDAPKKDPSTLPAPPENDDREPIWSPVTSSGKFWDEMTPNEKAEAWVTREGVPEWAMSAIQWKRRST